MSKLNFITGDEVHGTTDKSEKGLTRAERYNLLKSGLRTIEPPKGIHGKVFMASITNCQPYCNTYLMEKRCSVLDLARNGLRFNQEETTIKNPHRLTEDFVKSLATTFSNFTKQTVIGDFEDYYARQINKLLEENDFSIGRNSITDVAITRPILSSNENVYYFVIAKTCVDTFYIKYHLKMGV